VARKKTDKRLVELRASLAGRIREIRQERFGENGRTVVARRLNVPDRSWYNYEAGHTVPAEILLSFIRLTGVNPMWLLQGKGQKYYPAIDDLLSELTPMVTIALRNLPKEPVSEFVAVDLYPLADIARTILDPGRVEGHVLAYRNWLPNRWETIGTRLTDDAMDPILPAGSIVAVDRSATDPRKLKGQIVAACPDGTPMIRRLSVDDRLMILQPNHSTKEFPPIAIALDKPRPPIIVGKVIWSWSRFGQT
jgi:Peptidase S24-like